MALNEFRLMLLIDENKILRKVQWQVELTAGKANEKMCPRKP